MSVGTVTWVILSTVCAVTQDTQTLPPEMVPDINVDPHRDATSVKSTFDEVLSSPEYRRLHDNPRDWESPDLQTPSLLQRFFRWLGRLFRRTTPTTGSS